jgi:hypothetical protein
MSSFKCSDSLGGIVGICFPLDSRFAGSNLAKVESHSREMELIVQVPSEWK